MTQVLTDWINPGCILITDEWRSYFSAATRAEIRRHETVNHIYQFVSETVYHTNNVESLWSSLKRWMCTKKYIYSPSEDILPYLTEYILSRNIQMFMWKAWEEY